MGRAFPSSSRHTSIAPAGARQESVRPLLQVNREIVVPGCTETVLSSRCRPDTHRHGGVRSTANGAKINEEVPGGTGSEIGISPLGRASPAR